jgi:hypothetical protein
MRCKPLFRIVSGIAAFALFVVFFACTKDTPSDDNSQPYNFDAILHSTDLKNPEMVGLLKFRQDPDTARIITLDTYISNLIPNHDYILQRAVNPITDADCTSVAWLTLGLGLTPQTIHTDSHGNGHEKLFRDITAIARGTTFRIHFQIVDVASTVAVLASDCEQYTVR